MIAAEIRLLQETLQDTRSTSLRQSLLKRIYHLNRDSQAASSERAVAREQDPEHDDERR